MRVEEALLRLLLGDCGLSCAHYVNWAIPHQSLRIDELGLRNVPNANVVHRIRVSLACHDDPLFLAESGRHKKRADYAAMVRRVKRFLAAVTVPIAPRRVSNHNI
jgi:hypothetical protein